MKKLAIIVTHPIQYYVPLFQLLAKSCDLKVFYTWGIAGAAARYDPDFKQIISWDLPLLEGYTYDFLENTAKDPGSHHFNGIVNPQLINKLKSFNPAAILVYGWSYHSHLQILRKFKGHTPLWFRGDSNLLDLQKGIKQVLRSIFLKWVYRHVDKVFYVGSANKNYYLKFGLKTEQLVFAPHAIENDRFATDRKIEVVQFREQLHIGKEELLILFAGKLETKKNPLLLLEAFIQLKKEKVHLLFVGNGELEESLKLKAKNVHHQNIHFLAFQNQTQMPVVYQACDVFCLPSQGPGETWGLAVNEAMAAAKPVLVSNRVGCADDLVVPKLNGEIFESTNLHDLVTKLNFLLSNSNLLRNMGQLSKERINHWNIPAQASSILNALQSTHES